MAPKEVAAVKRAALLLAELANAQEKRIHVASEAEPHQHALAATRKRPLGIFIWPLGKDTDSGESRICKMSWSATRRTHLAYKHPL